MRVAEKDRIRGANAVGIAPGADEAEPERSDLEVRRARRVGGPAAVQPGDGWPTVIDP